ncbi:MAG: serine protease [Deltaproteobacteria bacterium]|nr:serine protease [Deltaproteobacteria bacterium]
MSEDMTPNYNQNPQPYPPVPITPYGTPQEPRSNALYYLVGIALGIVLALIFLLIFYKFIYPGLSREVAVAKLDPGALQSANLDALQAEIDRYKAALAGDVCLAPPLPDSIPMFRADENARPEVVPSDGTTGVSGADSTVPYTTGVPPLPPINPTAGDLVEEATVLIIADGAKEMGMGTGFFINDNQILTNRHVIDHALGKGGSIVIINKSLGNTVDVIPVAMTDAREDLRDYCILEIQGGASSRAHLTFSTQAKRTDRVGAWGYPGINVELDPQLEALLEGNTRSVPEVVYTSGDISVIQNTEGIPIINHTAEVSHGNSGGPLVDLNGDVLGINTLIFVDPDSNRQVNVALGSDDIIKFLQANNITFEQRQAS